MKLLVLGDSLSDGGWARDPAGVGSAWPAGLARLAPEAGLAITNRAQGGSRSVEVLSQYRESGLEGFDAVAVFAGANDLWRRFVPWQDHAPVDADDFGRNLVRICELARTRGTREVWILTPTLLHADPDHAWNQELAEYRDACARVAREAAARLIPTGEEFEAAVRAVAVKWTYDGVHPRPVGQERLAWTVFHHALGGGAMACDKIPAAPAGHRLVWP